AASYDYAGDAFALVFAADGPLEAAALAPRVVTALARLVDHGGAAPLACSFGAACLPAEHEHVARVLALAEHRLDEQKAAALTAGPACLGAHVLVARRAYLAGSAAAGVDPRVATALAAHLEAVELPATMALLPARSEAAAVDSGLAALARLHALLDTGAVV